MFWLTSGFRVIQYHQKTLTRYAPGYMFPWYLLIPLYNVSLSQDRQGRGGKIERKERRWNKQREQNGMQWPRCSADDTSRKHFIHQRGGGLSLWKLLQIKDTPWWIELWGEWIWIPHLVNCALRRAVFQPLVTVLLFRLLSPAFMPEWT